MLPLQKIVSRFATPRRVDFFAPMLKRAFSAEKKCRLIYDGDCPACYRFVMKFDNVTDLELVNARDGSNPLVQKIEKEKGKNIFDTGMAFVDESGRTYHGADALKALSPKVSELGKKAALFAILKNYPAFVAVRNMLIKKTIAEQRAEEESSSSRRLRPF